MQVFIKIEFQKIEHTSYIDQFHMFYFFTQHPCPKVEKGHYSHFM